jgi:hypothetical protein
MLWNNIDIIDLSKKKDIMQCLQGEKGVPLAQNQSQNAGKEGHKNSGQNGIHCPLSIMAAAPIITQTSHK